MSHTIPLHHRPGGSGGAPAANYPFLLPPVEADELGRLGSYRVLRLLGEGGMGFVFHAEDVALRRPVALKVMRPDLGQDHDGWERFLREARTMASLKHDHLVTVYQVGQENGLPYLAMELLQGESLDHWMKRPRTVGVAEILRLGREIAGGLHAIHRQGLVHRDIKPANVWLEAAGGRVKILDFGLARVVRDDAGLTRSGMVLGTPAFMAPEQARGEAADARSDLFSLGCVLYELCSGTRPFDAPTTMAALTALAVKDPPPLHKLRPALPRDLADLVMQLLAKEPGERPASAAAVLARLRKTGSRPAVPAPPPSRPMTAAKPPAPSRPSATQQQEAPPRPRTRTRLKKSRAPRPNQWKTALIVALPAVVLTVGSAVLVPLAVARLGAPVAATAPAPAPASLTFLSDLRPAVDNNPIASPPAPPDAPAPPPFFGVRVHDQPSPHGIFMHPPLDPFGGTAGLSYKLGKQYGVFRAETSLNDGPPEAFTPLTFSVFGDGRLLWQSRPIRRQADADRCEVPLRGVDLLTIQVNCPGDPRGAHAAWVEPRLAP